MKFIIDKFIDALVSYVFYKLVEFLISIIS